MTDETLKYYIALQEKFRERMQALQKGDRFIVNGHEYFYGDPTWWFGLPIGKIPKTAVIVPDVYSCDPDRPERGLIGMLDWSSVDLWMVAKDWCEIKYRQEVIARGPLDLALLRALDKEGGR